MNHAAALLAHNATTAQHAAATALIQDLVTELEAQAASIKRLEELVRGQAAELETLRKETP